MQSVQKSFESDILNLSHDMILLMIEILHDLKDPKPWELW